tara:strand:+ start:9781 stop:10392 length:612 start_codon:yes stop_codon:yes gene_type:complete
MKLFELIIDENQEFSGVQALSLVESPAIMSDWVALGDQKPVLLAEVDKDKQILMGAALIPDKPIYRNMNGEEFYIYFSKETIAKTAEQFFKNSNQNNATLEHQTELKGMTVFESWLVEDPAMDKSKSFGLDVPTGTWMVSMKVNDKNIWDDYVKDNKVFGFSIEGAFSNVLRKESIEDMNFSDQVLDGALDLVRDFIKKNINN